MEAAIHMVDWSGIRGWQLSFALAFLFLMHYAPCQLAVQAGPESAGGATGILRASILTTNWSYTM